MWAMRVVLAVLVLAASGCSIDGEDRDGDGASRGGPPVSGAAFPGAGVDCPAEDPQPVTAELATAALVRSGFDVDFDPRACGLGEIAGMLGNAASSPNAIEDEGIVVCFLFVRPRSEGIAGEGEGETGAVHAERTVANLTCDLYAGRAPVDDEVTRLDEAFEDLRARIR